MANDAIVLEFKGEMAKLRKELDQLKKQLGIIDKEADEANKSIGKMDKQSTKISSSFKKLGAAVAAAFSVAVIKQFISESIRLADIQLKAEAQLLTALKGRKSVQQNLIKQASELQSLTTFGDEEIIKAQSLIAAFVKEEDQIKALTKVTLDLAAAKGFDLSSAGDLITKTFASSTNALSRYGITVEGAAGSSERLESLTTALTNAFGGQAETLAQTGAGGLQQLSNIIGDIKEEFGIAILNGIRPFQDEIKETVLTFGSFIKMLFNAEERTGKLGQAAQLAADYFGKVKEVFIGIGGVIKSFIGFWVDLGKAIGLVNPEADTAVVAMNALSKAFEYGSLPLRFILEQLQNYIETLRGVIRATSEAASQIKEFFSGLSASVGLLTSGQFSAASQTFKNIAFDVEAIKNAFNGLNQTSPQTTKSIGDLTSEFVKMVNEFEEAGGDTGVIQETTDRIVQQLIPALNQMKATTIDGKDAIQGYIDGLQRIEVPELDLEEKGFFGFTETEKNEAIQGAAQAFGEISNLAQIANDRRLQSLQDQLNRGLISEKEYQKEVAKVKAKQARADKLNALFQIGINTATAITKALPNPILVAFAAAIGAAQLAAVAARPVPKFEKGGEVGGRRHAQGGTLIEAEKGEYVINRSAYAANKQAVEAINTNRFHDYIMKEAQKVAIAQGNGVAYDDTALIYAINKNRTVRVSNFPKQESLRGLRLDQKRTLK